MLEEFDSELRRAHETAAVIQAHCCQGENIQPLADELAERVQGIATLTSQQGLNETQTTALKKLAQVVFDVTAAVEANKQTVMMELESITHAERVRRIYARGAG
jgi:plasmid rolling circle replication initiator protein Rep